MHGVSAKRWMTGDKVGFAGESALILRRKLYTTLGMACDDDCYWSREHRAGISFNARANLSSGKAMKAFSQWVRTLNRL